jgi:serine/threonine protein phosphatase 1
LIIQHFSQNTQGRDFIIGDIHGCFNLLETALEQQNFNPSSDRCFSVGDLVDRGPHSGQVLNWLEKPWFHSCLGNHEEMLIEQDPNSEKGQYWFESYGGDWWLALTENERSKIIAALETLPLAIEVETAHGLVGIVHADVPDSFDWPQFCRFLEMGDITARQESLWGRRRATGAVKTPVEGIDRIICGHTVTTTRQTKIVGNVWFIDTGLYFDDGATHLNLINLHDLFK